MLLQSLLRPVLTPLMRGMFDAPIASSAAWSPADLASLTAWYDPSDLSTMFQDAAGTTPVTAAGQPVGLILDKSGNGHHASQTTSTARPLFQIDGSGNAHLVFDGVDDYLSTAAIDLTSTDKVTVFAGASSGSSMPYQCIAIQGDIGADDGSFALAAPGISTSQVTAWRKSLTGRPDLSSSSFPNPCVTTVVLDMASTTVVGALSMRTNGVAATEYSGAAPASGVGANKPLYIGGGWGLNYLNGNLYSLIIGGTAYDAATVLAAETWVADKTGVTL